MLRFFAKNSNLLNLARVLAYPIVKVLPGLRTSIVVVAEKVKEFRIKERIVRWG